MDNLINPFSVFDCQIWDLLPIEETVPACDIVLKCEVRIGTGKMIDCVRIGMRLLMSRELYDTIKNEFKDETIK